MLVEIDLGNRKGSWTCGQRGGARKPRVPQRDTLVCRYVMCPEVKQ